MYDKYPEHDVPQNNIAQRFFGQRWSAIVIEILLTIVITVAAGRAFDFFGPLEPSADTAAIELAAELPPEIAEPGERISIDAVRHMARSYHNDEDYVEARTLHDLLIALEPDNEFLFLDRAKVASAMGDYSLAYRDTYTALRLEPEARPWYMNNLLCYYAGELGEYELALAHCTAVLEGDENPRQQRISPWKTAVGSLWRWAIMKAVRTIARRYCRHTPAANLYRVCWRITTWDGSKWRKES